MSSSVLACLMTVTLHTLMYVLKGNILPSDSPGKSATHGGLRECSWMIQFSHVVVRLLL